MQKLFCNEAVAVGQAKSGRYGDAEGLGRRAALIKSTRRTTGRQLTIASISVLLIGGCGEKLSSQDAQKKTPEPVVKVERESPVEASLKRTVVNLAHDKDRYSLSNFCSTVADEKFEYTFGSVDWKFGDQPARTLPAVLARHRFTCLIQQFGTKEEKQQWVLAGDDAAFGVVRCVMLGPLNLVSNAYLECNFRTPDGKFPFPPPEQVPEKGREAYSLELAKLKAKLGIPPADAAQKAEAVITAQQNATPPAPESASPPVLDAQRAAHTHLDSTSAIKSNAEPVKPSFDCTKASSANERLICSDQELAKMDVELADLYALARSASADKAALRTESLDALKHRESSCSDKACLQVWYAQRKASLLKAGRKE